MANFSDSFTQGGQTQLHKFHMIRQVLGSTLKAGLAMFAVTFGYFIWANHCWQDFWFLLCYFKAWLRVDFLEIMPRGFFDESWLVDGKGSVLTVSDFQIVHADFYQNLKTSIWFGLLKRAFYSLMISIVGVAFVSWFWVKMGRKKRATTILSGFECVLPKVLRKKVLKFGASPYTISNVSIPKDAEFQHMMVTGTTGAGKSNMIHQLLQQIRDQGDQAIVVDTTGGIFTRFYDERNDLYLNPLDMRSAKWNIWNEAQNDYVIDEIAESIIPDQKSLDSFWIQGARQLFGESVRYLKGKKDKSYNELIKMTLKIDLRELKKRIGHTTAATMLEPSIEKTALSIRASLANNLKILQHLDETDEGLSILNFMKHDHKMWLFLSCQTDQRAFVKPIFSVWLSLVIKGMMARSENNKSRTWIIIDELASLNKLPSLMTGLSEIRKYGGCFVLGFQDLGQVEDIYGNSSAKTLSNLTGTKVLFRAVDTDVAARVARYMGEQEKEVASESISFGAHQMRDGVNLSHQVQTKPVITASQVMLLENLEAYLKFPGTFPVSKIKFSYLRCAIQNVVYIAKPAKPKEDEEKDKLTMSREDVSDHSESSCNVISLKFDLNQKNETEAPAEAEEGMENPTDGLFVPEEREDHNKNETTTTLEDEILESSS
jgi:type IV conjugative transfer system coupling protein TraD